MLSMSFKKTGHEMYPFAVEFKGERLFESEETARSFMRLLDEL